MEEDFAQRVIKKRKSIRENRKLREQKIYTLGGEIFSAITHGITAALGVAALVLLIVFASRSDYGARAVVSVTIFGVFALAGFLVSTIYHSLAINKGKRVFRVLDHCSIYFIIAGTYTPFSLLAVGGWIGWVLFSIVWGLAVIGCALTAIDRERFKKFAFACYLIMGWMGVVAAVPLISNIGIGASFWLLLGGGVAYTLGAIVYKQPGKYTHGIWHLFTMAGLVLQFLSILFLLV
ncbi:MAG: hemolysin III family protein [Firmicutes bacterium]|nr:hemolysin III family protein [Bacillota bacterium]